jgi:hypothetical protein
MATVTDAEIGPPTPAAPSPVHPIALEINVVEREPLGAQPLERLLLPVHDVRLAFLPRHSSTSQTPPFFWGQRSCKGGGDR